MQVSKIKILVIYIQLLVQVKLLEVYALICVHCTCISVKKLIQGLRISDLVYYNFFNYHLIILFCIYIMSP
jgi:hypothetical protein